MTEGFSLHALLYSSLKLLMEQLPETRMHLRAKYV